jgi:hypothetical protein
MSVKNLFADKYKVMSKQSASDLTGSATPVESSDYIESYLARKERFLPPINYATASNFAKFGSAVQYSEDAITRVYNTYPYDGSLKEKIDWFNRANFYDIYIFNHRYPRTCGYAVFSPNGWGSLSGSKVNSNGLSDSPEYIQIKGGPHADPNSGSLKLSRQFPEPWDGKANVWDNTTGINRESNLALDLDKGATIELWFKKGDPSSPLTDTSYETIFDVWNGYDGATEGNSYGRMALLWQSTLANQLVLPIYSGSVSTTHLVSETVNTALEDGNWHHIAVTIKQTTNDAGANYVEFNDFLDGEYIATEKIAETTPYGSITGSMIANIGALRRPSLSRSDTAALSSAQKIDGYGKLSGSIDEFRYWKTARTAQEISRFWFTQIGGGTNTDGSKFSGSAQPVALGAYYKFNEGNTGTDTIDSTVLDYSGRISNGTWTGFISGSSRVAGETASAMIESSASLTEFKEPIIYSSHPLVADLSSSLIEEGREWDLNNNMAIYHTIPEWITSEDQDTGGETLKKLTQIIASYLDTTYLQIQAVPTLPDIRYPYEELIAHNPNEHTEAKTKVRPYSNSPVPFAKNMVEGAGLHAPEIFAMANELAQLANRDEYREFDQKLYDVKNTIYQNIYNNLVYIYKSKGTEKAFRNLIRCYGVDDELIKINLYTDGATYSFDSSNYRSTSVKSKYIDFNEIDRTVSTIYQSASEGTANSISYIPGWNPTNALTADVTGSAISFEADIIFPLKFERTHPSNLWYDYQHLTSSLFGCHTAQPTVSSPENFAWAPAAVGTATYMFSAVPAEETTVTLTDYEGTSVIFEVDDTGNGAATGGAVPMNPAASNALGMAAIFVSVINASAIKITALQPAPSQPIVLLSQDVGGTAGNKTIAYSNASNWESSTATDLVTVFIGGTDDRASFEVYALRPKAESKDVKFMLTSSNENIPTLTSSLYTDVYNNERWLFAVRIYPDSPLEGPHISGSTDSVSGDWTIEFQGCNPLLDQIQNNFTVSDTFPSGSIGYFMNANKRIYAGAHRQDFSGSLLYYSDVKVGAVRVWDDYISDYDFSTHAKDPTNFGRERAYKSAYLFNQENPASVDTTFIPQFETLLLNWTFADITGSTNGVYLANHYGGSSWNSSFEVLDFSSGSDDKWGVSDRYKYHYTGRGDWFLPDVAKVVDLNFLSVVKTNLPEVMSGEDMISILTTDDNYFTRDSVPVNHYFAIEKSMYQTISEEMLSMFASTLEFNNLIGEPINRYRQEYKSLGKVREAFFRKVGNIPDFNKFVNFYKWIDDSLTVMLMQLIPMTANFSYGVKNMIESHILERNKYWTKFPTLEMKAEPPTGFVKGINELTYDWEHGHAPLNPTQYSNEDTNCLWWRERGEASGSTSGDTLIDTDRNTLRRILTSDVTTNKILATGEYTDPTDYPNSGFPNAAQFNLSKDGNSLSARTQYKGSTYALRRFSKPYRMEAEELVQIHGGINYHANKRRELTKGWTTTVGNDKTGDYASTTPSRTNDLLDCDDVLDPFKKEYHGFTWDTTTYSTTPFDYDLVKGDHYAPFNLVSSSVASNASLVETGIDLVNLHVDSYGNSDEVPMQGPFTERHVGGMAHRHQDISDGTHTSQNRSENFRITNVIKDATFAMVPGNHESAGEKRDAYPFDRYYRDGIAKRPVNIRNIKTQARQEHIQGSGLLAEFNWTSQQPFKRSQPTSDPDCNWGWITATDRGRVYLLSGSMIAAADIDDPPPQNIAWRYATPEASFAQPLEIKFSFIAGDVTIDSPDIPGGFVLNSPETSTLEHLYLQYSYDKASWTTATYFDADTYEDQGWVDTKVDINDGTNRRIYIRWIAGTANYSYHDHWAFGDVRIVEHPNDVGNHESPFQFVSLHNDGTMFRSKLSSSVNSLYDTEQPVASDNISDTYDRSKTLAVGQTLLDSETALTPPYAPQQFNPYRSKHKITERFSAPGGPDTAGDAFGGFGLDRCSNKYSVYNALPWRNLAVRQPLDAMLTTHCAIHGALPNSNLSDVEPSTALTASFHKTPRNIDYDIRDSPGLTAYRSESLLFDSNDVYARFDTGAGGLGALDVSLKHQSVSLWVRRTSAADQYLFLQYFNGAILVGDVGTYLAIPASGKIEWAVDTTPPGGTNKWLTSESHIEVNKWAHLVFVWDKDSADSNIVPKIYVNGKSVAVDVLSSSPEVGDPQWYTDPITDIVIGFNSLGFTGNIQDVSWWNRALNCTEVKNLYRLPGYDSAGPGDLSRIKFVTNNKKSNALIAWWKLGDSVSTLTDSAPIGNGYNLRDGGGAYQAAVDTTDFLPANYYDTSCIATYDNWYIQHPIPANEFGYAWITASANKDEGCDLLTTASFVTSSDVVSVDLQGFSPYGRRGYENDDHTGARLTPNLPTDFAGMNYHIYEPVTSSDNVLGYPSLYMRGNSGELVTNYDNFDFVPYGRPNDDTRPQGVVLNNILSHRNGPYGYPSWKQIRTGDHPIVRQHKKNNILSVSDEPTTRTLFHRRNGSRAIQEITEMKASTHTNYVESPVSMKGATIIHRVESVARGIPQSLTVQHTYANNLITFANAELAERFSSKNIPRQLYDDFKDMYLGSDEAPLANPLKAFKSLIYRETIYPKENKMFLSGTRGRLYYAETAAVISQSANGAYRTFWRDNLADRRRDDGALNSMGYPITPQPNQAAVLGDLAEDSPMWVLGSGSLSIWPLDVGVGNSDHLVGVNGNYQGIPGHGVFAPDTALAYGEEYGGTWGELQRDPNASLFASMTTTQLTALNNLSSAPGKFLHFMADKYFKCAGTASVCLNFFDLAGISGEIVIDAVRSPHNWVYPIFMPKTAQGWTSGPGDIGSLGERGPTPSNWQTHYWSGRNPWYDSYEDYADDIRNIGKDYTIVPEFKISDHMDYYLENGTEDTKNFKFLSLEGATYTSSADAYAESYNEPFWKEYCHSDFMKHFNVIQKDHEGVAGVSTIAMKCSVVKKLLPYNGFYPVQRSIQLAGLLSSSYAPFISGSSVATYGLAEGATINESGRDKYFAERLQSFLQPFYAPGIFYNTIKSGIAVDYPIHTSSAPININNRSIGGETDLLDAGSEPYGMVNSASGSMQAVTDVPSLRMPFEALINPDPFLPISSSVAQATEGTDPTNRGRMYLTAPYYGSSSFYATWNGTSKPNYSLAANNFAAEVPNFFLKNKTLTTYRSGKESSFKPMTSGTTYFMDVILYKTPDMIMNRHSKTDTGMSDAVANYYGLPPGAGACTGWGFGPKYANHFGTANVGTGNGTQTFTDWNEGSPNFSVSFTPVALMGSDPAWAPHAPPYLYGRSVARLAFTPDEVVEMAPGQSLTFNVDDILANVKIDTRTRYFQEVGAGTFPFISSALSALEEHPTCPAAVAAMKLSSSINLFGKTELPAIEFDAVTQQPLSAQQTGEQSWVIHSKWECPTLNFANGTGGGLGPGETAADMAIPSGDYWTGDRPPVALQRPLGMWNGYGSQPTGETGIFFGLRESFPHQLFKGPAVEISSEKSGSLLQACGFQPEERRVGELASGKWISEAVVAIPFVDVEGRRKFFSLGNTQGQSRNIWLKALTGREGPGRSIRQMAARMPKYVIPPHLDFVSNKSLEPFAMYIFEFNERLNQQDLSNIWQNVMPDIAVTAKKSATALIHQSGENEFFRGNKIPKYTRWMVFKVKRRAATDYFKMTADATDDHMYSFKFGRGGHKRISTYTYNWPYDFFSLVELAKVEVKIGVGDESFPVPPYRPLSDNLFPSVATTRTLASARPAATSTNISLLAGGSVQPDVIFLDPAVQEAAAEAQQDAAQELDADSAPEDPSPPAHAGGDVAPPPDPPVIVVIPGMGGMGGGSGGGT